jgi:hypothetical protein
MIPKGARAPLIDALLLSHAHLVLLCFCSRSFAERSGFGRGGFDSDILETIDGTCQWLLRSALRSKHARFGLVVYAVVLQVVASFAVLDDTSDLSLLLTLSLQMWVLFIIAFHAHQPIIHSSHKRDPAP